MTRCLDDHGDGTCRGEVAFHSLDPGVTKAFPRCEFHWDKRLDQHAENMRRYPVHEPADFDPMFAGERWDDDY